MLAKKRTLIGRAIAVLLVGMFGISGTVSAATLCETIVEQAYKRLDTLCSTVNRNQACYGNDAIRAEFDTAYDPQTFRKAGDKAPIASIRELYTLPMDMLANTWGLSLLKVQTNLPDTAPGQNVIFILYGDVRLTNADETGKMNAFYFTSGLGQPACKNVPADGITIRSPKGTRVQFNANGVNIDIGSTVTLQAQPHKALTVELIEGSAHITAANKTQTLQPGQSLSIPLGGSDGLQASGTPSAPVKKPLNPAQKKFIDSIPHAMPIITVTPPSPANKGNGQNKPVKPKKDDKKEKKDKPDKPDKPKK